jgi:hypothetical protein
VKTSNLVLVTLVALVASSTAWGRGPKPLKITVGPEQIILPRDLQPFMFRSNKGTLLIKGERFARSTDGGARTGFKFLRSRIAASEARRPPRARCQVSAKRARWQVAGVGKKAGSG